MTRTIAAAMARALSLSFALSLASWPAFGEEAKPLTTILLVAREDVTDSNFKNSTVLVMNNVGEAPAGVIVNRPTNIPVSRLYPDLPALAKLDDKLYYGGPVEIRTVSFVFRANAPPEGATQVLEGIYISTDLVLLRKLLTRTKPMDGLRVFIGYSGWARGQLEAEIARGDWRLAPADGDSLFTRKNEFPWPERSAPASGQRT